MSQEALSVFLQQNLLVLLTYYEQQAKIIRGIVSLELFDHDYRKIATSIYAFIDQHNTVPKDHLPELFEATLADRVDRKSEERARFLEAILYEIHDNQKKVNIPYTMDRLEKFIRHQEIKKAILDVADVVDEGEVSDTNIQKAEEIFTNALKRRSQLFDPGLSLGDPKRALAFLDDQDTEGFRTGIQVLDKAEIVPRRQTLFLFVGLPKQGKTWFLINVGKAALIDGHKVLHVSLEMSENQISRRYHQVLYAIAQKKDEIKRTRLIGVQKGELRDIKQEPFTPKHAFTDGDIYKYLSAKRRRIEKRLERVRIKSFPTGQLTLRGLEAYLDLMESQQNFVPDVLLIDYPRLMKISVKDHRLELGEIIKGTRGLAVERNMAVVAVSQSNRSGMKVGSRNNLPVLTLEHLAEDFSQAATADVVITYNQTLPERALKLARIFVAAARDREDLWTLLMSQNYDLGQFCWRSVRMGDDAQSMLLERLQGNDSDDSDEDD